jgi:two-component system cell cycle response regulator DivK
MEVALHSGLIGKPSAPAPAFCEANVTKRILVVEDQEDNRQILRDLLTNADYELMEAENGEEALAAVERQRPDLILMDIQLPILDGYETTRRIKANPALKDVPIIAVTSYALSGDEDKALAAGRDGFVPKPFSPRQLLAKIREYLRQPAPSGCAIRPQVVGWNGAGLPPPPTCRALRKPPLRPLVRPAAGRENNAARRVSAQNTGRLAFIRLCRRRPPGEFVAR